MQAEGLLEALGQAWLEQAAGVGGDGTPGLGAGWGSAALVSRCSWSDQKGQQDHGRRKVTGGEKWDRTQAV